MKGNLVKMPSWNKNKTIFEFRLAVDKVVKFKNNDDTYGLKTGYFNVKFFKDRANEVAAMNLGVGDLVDITGDDQIVEYVSANEPGVIKFDREILGRTIQLISKKSNKTNASTKNNQEHLDLDSDVDITEDWTM
jgi:single-stranded DNA-binding protein